MNMEVKTREKVLKSVRNALLSKTDNPFPNIEQDSCVFTDTNNPYIDITFAEEFSKVGGKFVYCENENELIHALNALYNQFKYGNTFCLDNEIKEVLTLGKIPFSDNKEDFLKTAVTITYCEYLVARFGSIMVSSRQMSGRKAIIYPHVHIVFAYTSQLVMDIKDAFNKLKVKYDNKMPSLISLITGPSRTADIEKTLVMGAHGPKELYVFLIEDRE